MSATVPMRCRRSLPRWSRSTDDRKPSAGCGSFPGLPCLCFLLDKTYSVFVVSGYGESLALWSPAPDSFSAVFFGAFSFVLLALHQARHRRSHLKSLKKTQSEKCGAVFTRCRLSRQATTSQTILCVLSRCFVPHWQAATCENLSVVGDRKALSTPSCVSFRAKKNGRHKADLPPAPAIYAAKTEAIQPPDDRTYSAEVTVFQRNLLHHRIAARRLRLHAPDYSNTHGCVCQLFF